MHVVAGHGYGKLALMARGPEAAAVIVVTYCHRLDREPRDSTCSRRRLSPSFVESAASVVSM